MSDETQAAAAAETAPVVMMSQGFARWMAENGCSVALTTYQAGRLFLIGRRPNGTVRAHERLIEQCQGLWTDGQTIWTSGLHAIWRFENEIPTGHATRDGVDRRFVPREGRVTGRIDCHDIGVTTIDGVRRPVFVSTLYNCLATVSETAGSKLYWKPAFISELIAEDRCHLNGLAMDGERPAFVSAVSRSDVLDGWRERRRDGGVIVDVGSGDVVATGLSMPHSPRLYDGRLWVLNSGEGAFGTVDPKDGTFTQVAFCPGYARGLAFVGRYAVIGLSRPRRNQTFEGLALDDRLAAKDTVPRCGLIVVDIDTGRTVEWLRFEHTIDELYDVAVLPGVTQGELVGFKGDDIQRAIAMEG